MSSLKQRTSVRDVPQAAGQLAGILNDLKRAVAALAEAPTVSVELAQGGARAVVVGDAIEVLDASGALLVRLRIT